MRARRRDCEEYRSRTRFERHRFSMRKAAQLAVRIRISISFECTSKQMAQGSVLSFPLFRPFKVCQPPAETNVLRVRREAPARRRYKHGSYTVRRGCSSAGRAPALQAGGRRFESAHLHQHIDNRIGLSRSSVMRVKQNWILFLMLNLTLTK